MFFLKSTPIAFIENEFYKKSVPIAACEGDTNQREYILHHTQT